MAGFLFNYPGLAQSGIAVAPEGPMRIRVCMTCHGGFGQGNEIAGGPKLAGMESWYLKRHLENFRAFKRGTQQDYIPGYEMRETAEVLTDVEIDELVSLIGAWEEMPVRHTVEGNVGNGQTLYQPCAACHGLDGTGNEILGAPALAARNDWYLVSQLKLFKSGYRGAHPEDTLGAQMRTMIQNLATEQEMVEVVAYINTL